MRRTYRLMALGMLLGYCAAAQDIAALQKQVSEFTLSNGMHFIVVERHHAPFVSFHLQVKAGSVNDPPGRSGLAHLMEHMAFKGTPTLGTQIWNEERRALDLLRETEGSIEQELKLEPRSADRLDSLAAQARAASGRAELYAASGEVARTLDEHGATGLNATTTHESIAIGLTLPSNQMELWFAIKSEWLRTPVLRELYREREKMREERDRTVDSNMQGRVQELFLKTAFPTHPYGIPAIGRDADIERLSLRDAERFFETWFGPGNLVASIAGDVNPAQVRQLAEKYFGTLKARPAPPAIAVREKDPGAAVRSAGEENASFVFIGHRRPESTHPDDIVFDVLSLALTGKSGLLERELVRGRKVAQSAQNVPTYPAGDSPNLFTTLLAVGGGSTVEEAEKAYLEVLERLKTTPLAPGTLDRIRALARSGMMRRLETNAGLAATLAIFHATYGTWKRLFTALDDLDKVTPEDAMRVAAKYFVDAGQVVTVSHGGSK